MEKEIDAFISYLHSIKNASYNTELSYHRDLNKFRKYMEARGIVGVDQIKEENLSDYIASLECQQLKAATISRNIASIKAFYQYLYKEGLVHENFGNRLRAPRVEKKLPDVITMEETVALLMQPTANTPKEIRDRSMLSLLYATGIRVTELMTLKLGDVDLQEHCLVCRDGERTRRIPFDSETGALLELYLKSSRPALVQESQEETLFVNCSGNPMSRQGFWKLIKNYARQAGIQSEITLQTLRHSLAVHMVQKEQI